MSEFHCQNPEALKHISAIDFTNLPFLPITNLTDAPDTVPSYWAIGQCMSGYHTFERGAIVRVFPL